MEVKPLNYDSSGFTNCIDCGVIQEKTLIDEGPEWRNFSKDGIDNSNERVGMPSTNLLHDKGLTTDIGWQNQDFRRYWTYHPICQSYLEG